MRFAVFTHVEHYQDGGKLYAYEPYVREMNLWFKQVSKIDVVAPLTFTRPDYAVLAYKAYSLHLNRISSINFLSIKSSFFSIITIPLILVRIYFAMKRAEHFHLRCPGNIGLLACLVQVLFPSKPKTVKYAGNWTDTSGQPLSYRFQRWILSNEFLSKNVKVLVYGDAKNNSKNIVPFFTASFTESERAVFKKQFLAPFKFIFVGSIVEGKRPLFGVKLVQELNQKGIPSTLDIYGTGDQFEYINEYVNRYNLKRIITLKGSCSLNELKKAYKNSHFIVLASKSEGWPKAVAEGMFYGCIPISTSVSCVPWMLGNGQRGILIKNDIKTALYCIQNLIENKKLLKKKSLNAQEWAQKYTLEQFEEAIKKFV